MRVLEEKENFLTNRKEIKIIAEADKNPTFQEAENLIVKEFKSDKENIVVKGVKGKFGRNTFLISAFIYKSKEDKEMFEPKVKGKKGQEQTQPAEQKTEQPKQEEKKEEKAQIEPPRQ